MISIGPLLDAVLADCAISRGQAGLLSLAFFVGVNTAILALNFVIGRMSSRRTLLLGAAFQAAGLLAFGSAQTLSGLCAAYFITGIGHGILVIFPGIYISSLLKDEAHRALSLVFGMFALGVTLAPAMIGFLLTRDFSWRTVIYFEAGASVLLIPLLLVLPVAAIQGRKNVTLKHLAQTWSFNSRLWLTLFFALLFYVGTESMVNVWLVKFQIDIYNVDPFSAGLILTLFWSGLTFGRLASVFLLSKVSAHIMAAVASLAFGIFILAASLSPDRILFSIFCLLAGISASVIFPLTSSYSSNFPAWLSGVVYSSLIFGAGMGAMLFPYLVGPLADYLGFRLALALAIIPAILTALMVLAVHRATILPEGSS